MPRRRRKETIILEATCCTRDGGRPSGAESQEQAPNRLQLHEPKALVVSVHGKGEPSARQVWVKKTNVSEPLMRCRKRSTMTSKLETGPVSETSLVEVLDSRPDDVRHIGGVRLTRALVRNVGTCCLDVKGEAQVGGPCKGKSTDARQRGGAVCSSEESLVMRLERRGSIVQPYHCANLQREERNG